MHANRAEWITSRAGVILGVLLAVRVVIAVLSPAGMDWDYTQYYRAGNRAFSGQIDQLYQLPRSTMDAWRREALGITPDEPEGDSEDEPGSPDDLVNSGRLGYVGFPLSAYLWATFGAFSPRTGLVIFKLECALSLALALLLLFPLFRRSVRPGVRAGPLYLAIALLFEPFWFSFSTGGQATPIAFLLLVLCWRALVGQRPIWAGLFLAILLPIKPFFVVLLPAFVLAGAIRAAASAVAFLVLLMGISVLTLGVPLHQEWWSTMQVSAGAIAEPWWQNVAILGAVYSFWTYAVGSPLEMVGEPSSTTVSAILLLFKFLVTGLCFYRAFMLGRHSRDAGERAHGAVVLGVLLGLFFSSIVWPHYLTFLFLPLIFWLVPSKPIPTMARLLAWLALISTLAVHSRFAQHYIVGSLEPLPFLRTAAASFFGCATLALALTLFVIYWKPLRETHPAADGDVAESSESS